MTGPDPVRDGVEALLEARERLGGAVEVLGSTIEPGTIAHERAALLCVLAHQLALVLAEVTSVIATALDLGVPEGASLVAGEARHDAAGTMRLATQDIRMAGWRCESAQLSVQRTLGRDDFPPPQT